MKRYSESTEVSHCHYVTLSCLNLVKIEHYRNNYIGWMISSILFASLAQACIQFISDKAAGSGIP